MKDPILAACAAVGLTAVLAACGGSTASPGKPASSPSPSATATSTSAALPAGYHRIGGPAQGVSLGVPSSWVSVNFAQQTLRQAVKKLGIHGLSQSTLTQDMQNLQKLHAVYAIDVSSIATSPHHYATNINAYCSTSGVTDTGSAGVALLRQSAVAEMQQIGATKLRQTDVRVGGVPGVRTAYSLSTSAEGVLRGLQLEVLPKADRACFITLTGNGAPSGLLAQIASTVQYP